MTYWFRSLATGDKVTATSLQEITRKAQREADRFGQGVQIHSGPAGRKSHRVASYARNPVEKPQFTFTHNGVRYSVFEGWIVKGGGYSGVHISALPRAVQDKAIAASGAKVTTVRKNPATKASKARRVASNKRGCYVEYIDGTKKTRKLYGNRGIATIRAKALKADGYRGVRLVSA